MKLHYTGPKPRISQHGIFFKNGKEDKYIYLKGEIHILHIIDLKHKHEFDNNIPDYKIVNMIKEYQTDIEKDIEEEKLRYEKKLQEEILKVQESNLNQIDKDTWIKNLKLMQDYRVQRAVNKLYYEHAIRIIVDIIEKNQIESMVLPFNKAYFHILESIQNALDNSHFHNKSNIEIIKDKENRLVLKFTIKHFKKLDIF